MNFGTLYIVATPIGNLEDISYRAIRILKSVSCVYAEDTRVVNKLFTKYNIDTKALSYHQHSSDVLRMEIVKRLVEGEGLAYVSDAGTPGISDPGSELVSFVLAKEPRVKVIPIPGPSAVTAALSVSGFKTTPFMFIGYFPRGKRLKTMQLLINAHCIIVFFERPSRLLRTLIYLKSQLSPHRKIFIGRELTKIYETQYRGTIANVVDEISSDIKSDKGEAVVVLDSTL